MFFLFFIIKNKTSKFHFFCVFNVFLDTNFCGISSALKPYGYYFFTNVIRCNSCSRVFRLFLTFYN